MPKYILKLVRSADVFKWKSLSHSYDQYFEDVAETMAHVYAGFDEYMRSKIAKQEAYMVIADENESECLGIIAFSYAHNRITFLAVSEDAAFNAVGQILVSQALAVLSRTVDISINVFALPRQIFQQTESLLIEMGFRHQGELTMEAGLPAKIYYLESAG